jgi:hypothetical protein
MTQTQWKQTLAGSIPWANIALAVGISICASAAMWAQDRPQSNPAPPAPAVSEGGWRQLGTQQQQADAAPDPAFNPVPPDQGAPHPASLTIPAGTILTVRITQPLSSDHNQTGDGFTAVLQQPLVADGIVVARRGQTVIGTVTEAEKAGRAKGVSHLGLEIAQLTLVDGQQVPVKSNLLERKGSTSIGRDAVGIGATAGVGAAVGAGVAGGLGAGVGAAAGAVLGSAGVLLTRGQPTIVYPETLLTFRLQTAVTISTERSEQAFLPVGPQDYEGSNQLRQRPPAMAYGGQGYPPPPPYYSSPYYAGAYPYPYYYAPYYGYGFGYGFGPSVFIGGGRFGYYGGFRGGFRR